MPSSRTLSLSMLLALAACKGNVQPQPAEQPSAHDHGDMAEHHDHEHPAKPHGGHEAHFGGVVMMTPDMHLEAVMGPDGHHRIYWSDQARDPLAASKLEKVALTIVRPGAASESLPLSKDPTDSFWEGQGQPLADPAAAEITVTYNRPGEAPTPQRIVFPAAAPMPSTLAEAAAAIEAGAQELAAIVKDGDLSRAHEVAERLKMLGAMLPDLAVKAARPEADVKALTVAGKKLGLLFDEMDEAGDAGKRPEAQAVFARYHELVQTIREKAAGAH